MEIISKIAIKKGTILQRQGELNTKVYIVESGLLRSYAIDNKGKEHIFMFAPENWIIADCLPADQPSELFIDALEDSILRVMEKKVENSRNTQSLLNRLAVLQQRVVMLMSASAIERYEHFEKTYPAITQRVPQKLIASYLGITPETLSHVKKTYYQNH